MEFLPVAMQAARIRLQKKAGGSHKWAGVGHWRCQAGVAEAYRLVQGGGLCRGSLLGISSLVRDLTYAMVDPRMKVG